MVSSISDFGRSETQGTIIDQITVVRGTAEEAIAHQLTINEWEERQKQRWSTSPTPIPRYSVFWVAKVPSDGHLNPRGACAFGDCCT